MVFLLLFAGFETTTHLITDSVIALEQNPEQKAYLFADLDARMERALEELGRYATPVQSTNRAMSRATALSLAKSLRAATISSDFCLAANYDPAVFADPDTLKLDRLPNPHLVFGTGIHFCLGMQLARVEAQSAIGRLYTRFPNFELAEPDKILWITRFGLRGAYALPLRLNAARSRKAA